MNDKIKLAMPGCLIHNRHKDLKQILARYRVELSFRPEFSLYLLNKYYYRGKDVTFEKLRYVYVRHSKGNMLYLYNRYPINRVPWILEIESLQRLLPQLNLGRRMKSKLLKWILSDRKCKYILPWSRYCADQIVKEIGIKGITDKIRVIYPSYPIELDALNGDYKKRPIENGKQRFLFVGKDFIRKGGQYLIDIFKDYAGEAELTIISTNVPGDCIETVKSSFNMSFLKGVPRQKLLSEIYASHDFIILPSIYESFGLVFLEAMKLGLVCVGSEVGAMKEIIVDKESGFIIKTPEYLKRLNNDGLNNSCRKLHELFSGRKNIPSEVSLSFRKNIKKTVEKCLNLGKQEMSRMQERAIEVANKRFSPDIQAERIMELL